MPRVRPRQMAPALVASALALAAPVTPAPPELRTLFPHQAPIYVDSDRLSRLELPAEILAACRPDLSDLRIFDRREQEVAFLVDSGLPAGERLEVTQGMTPEVLAVERRRIDRDDAPFLWRESYELPAPAKPSRTGLWDLVVGTDHPRFVRRVQVAGRLPDGRQIPLIQEASIFRLPNPLREQVHVTLPASAAIRVQVTLEGEDGFYLEPLFRYENTHSILPRERVVVELTELNRRHADRRTIVELERPRGLVPDILLTETSTPVFNRNIEIWDEGPGASDAEVGEGLMFRVRALTTVERVELSLEPARGDRLRVVVFNGDSPPLEDLAFKAVVRQPALIFALPAADASAPAGHLRFGGGRAYRPHYDLAGLPKPDRPLRGAAARTAESLYDAALLGAARLGPVEANPHFDPSPVLAFAMRPAARLDPRLYRHRRPLHAEPSAEGLIRLRLTPEDLARAQPDLADLRIIDSDSRQWAFLVEEDAAHETLPLQVEEPRSEDGRSRYRLLLAVTPVAVDQIVIDTPVPFFDRAFELTASRDGEDQVALLTRGRLVRRIGDPRPVKISFPETRIDSLELEVADGDDSPLEITHAAARLPVPELYFAAPAGDYALLLGNPEASAPRYELARVRQVVLAVASSAATTGELQPNHDYSPSARLGTRRGLLKVLLWIAVVAVVLVLTFLTLRLARQEGA